MERYEIENRLDRIVRIGCISDSSIQWILTYKSKKRNIKYTRLYEMLNSDDDLLNHIESINIDDVSDHLKNWYKTVRNKDKNLTCLIVTIKCKDEALIALDMLNSVIT